MMEITHPVLDQRDGQGGVDVTMATGLSSLAINLFFSMKTPSVGRCLYLLSLEGKLGRHF